MLRYAWQNAGYDNGEPVDNFTGVSDVAFSTDIIECAVMNHVITLLFFTVRFAVIHIALSIKSSLAFIVKISALHVASTMTSLVIFRACLHRFADKRHSPAHSEAHNNLVTKISYKYIRSNPNTILVRLLILSNLFSLKKTCSKLLGLKKMHNPSYRIFLSIKITVI